MAKKKVVLSEELKSLKDNLQQGKIIIGTERVMKGVKNGSIKEVFLAKNCPQDVKEDFQHYAKLSGFSVIELGMDNEELGVFCKKNFFIAVLGTTGE